MNSIKYLIIFLVFVFSACKKDEGVYYNISGLSDVVYKYDTLNIPIKIDFREGIQEYVQLSVEGLPDNMVASFSTVGGTPSFESVLQLSHKGLLQEGNYTISIVGTNVNGKRRTVQFKLKLIEGCAYSLAGTYLHSYVHKGDTGFLGLVTLQPDANNPNKINVRNYESKALEFYLLVNCKDSTVDYPLQLEGSGKGFYRLVPKKYIEIDAAYPDGKFDYTILLGAYK